MQTAFNQTRVLGGAEVLISATPARIAGIFPELTTTGTVTVRNARVLGSTGAPMHRAAVGLLASGKQFNAYGVALGSGLAVRLSAAEVRSSGTVTIAGAAGSVDTITVGGVNVLNAVVPFNASLTQTAADVAASINLKGLYTATAAAAVVTIFELTDTGVTVNGLTVSGTLTTLTATYTNMTGGVVGDAVTIVWAPLL